MKRYNIHHTKDKAWQDAEYTGFYDEFQKK